MPHQPITRSNRKQLTAQMILIANHAEMARKVLMRIQRASLRARIRAAGGSAGLAGKAPVR